MKCPHCACQDTRVIDSREPATMDTVRRRRQCVACERRFTTYERYEMPDLRIRKRSGRIEDFERDKLELGVLKACKKRPVSREAIEGLLDSVEDELRGMGNMVSSMEIGGLVLEKLKALDEVAYLRFASVYKEFVDAAQFEREVKNLRQVQLETETGTATETEQVGKRS